MDTFSHNKKHKILVSLFLSFAKIQKKSNYASNRLIISAFLRN
ncbi:hypothetical protein PREVCOP_05200 [Segatella copri DSM 18205]|uniref:Uncharacterized protein n=1 Tax=Segatella copri DSM 18205 TaxID=537011 RepID=D1PDB2_9BACT|nr:hypothetical protein PREVCOP_05200 [Segatella copri DSM 18205]